VVMRAATSRSVAFAAGADTAPTLGRYRAAPFCRASRRIAQTTSASSAVCRWRATQLANVRPAVPWPPASAPGPARRSRKLAARPVEGWPAGCLGGLRLVLEGGLLEGGEAGMGACVRPDLPAGLGERSHLRP